MRSVHPLEVGRKSRERRFLLFLLLAARVLLLPASVPETHYNAVVTPGHGIKGTTIPPDST